jgi:protein TonB
MIATAFEWRSYDQQVNIGQEKNTNSFEELMEVPVTVQPPPPAPVVQQPQIVEVPDDVEVQENLNIEFDVEAPVLDLPALIVETAEEEVDEIFTIVEEGATPVGGMPKFYQYLKDNMKYPAVARRAGVEGKVLVSFVVGKDGSISEVTVLKGIGAGCDEEAVRVMANAPHWKPGKQRGKAVRQRCVLPIKFSF